MAITWELEITPLDIPNKVGSIKAIRTDSEDPNNPKTYIEFRTLLETQEEQLAAMDSIWAKHKIALAKDAVVQEFLDELEEQGKNNLEARE